MQWILGVLTTKQDLCFSDLALASQQLAPKQSSKDVCRVSADVLHELWVTACHLHRLGGPVEGAQRLAGSPAA